MNILFVHNNFPGQYRHLVQALARDPKVRMMAIGTTSAREMEGVKLLRYRLNGVDVSASHPFSRRFDLECHRAEQVLYALSSLASSDFVPDVILAHPGWGETLPLRTIFPDARILLYCEFFYGMNGRDVGERGEVGRKEFAGGELVDLGAFRTLDEHFDRAVGQLQELQDRRDGTDAIEVFRLGIVHVRLLLGNQQNPLVRFHRKVEREN